MNFLITAAGLGSRFLKSGIKPPKPLILVKGLELLLWSLSSFSFYKNDNLYIVSLKQDNVKSRLENKIKLIYPNINVYWYELPSHHKGQLLTALKAIEYFAIEGPITIHNCDTAYSTTNISSYRNPGEEYFGAIPYFNAKGDHWSFLKVNSEKSLVMQVTEKIRISEHCSVGTYIFRDAGEMFNMSQKYIDSLSIQFKNSNELYIAPLYQYALVNNKKILPLFIEGVKVFGTCEELLQAFGISYFDLLSENAWSAHQRKTIVVDIDGTICSPPENNDYSKCTPLNDLCLKLIEEDAKGTYIILCTARNLRQFKGNLGFINKYTAPTLQDWLKLYQIPYDEIYYGKQWGQGGVTYIDDKNMLIKDFINA